jgi:hypothetical protein
MKLSAILQLSHQFAQCRAIQSALASAVTKAFFSYQQMQSAQPYAAKGNHRAAQRLTDAATAFVVAADIAWALDALVASHELYMSEESQNPQRFSLNVDETVEFITNSGNRPLSDDDVLAVAKAARLPVDKVRAMMDKDSAAQLDKNLRLAKGFTERLNEQQFTNDAERDIINEINVPAARVAEWIEARTAKVMSYQQSDRKLGSLTLLAADREIVEREAVKEEERADRANERDRAFDENGLSSADMKAATAD